MEEFIEAVKKYPIIWNMDSKEYHNLTKKEAAWKAIVEEVNDEDIPNVKIAKNEWKKLRDCHRESLKRMRANGNTSPPRNPWKYAELLEFLLPHMKIRNKYRTGFNQNSSHRSSVDSNLHGTSISQNDDEDPNFEVQIVQSHNDDSNLLSEHVRRKKRKIAAEADVNNAEDDTKKHPLNLFFDSMCESTKKLPDWIQRDVKKKILNLVSEAEETFETYLSTQSNRGYTSSSAYSTPVNDHDQQFSISAPMKTEIE